MKVGGFEKLLPYGFPCTALEQDIIRDHDCGAPVIRLEHGAHVLEKVQLLVGSGRPEVLPIVGQILLLLSPLLVREVERAFLPEGGIRENVIVVVVLTRRTYQCVGRRNASLSVDFADVVKK